MIGNALCDVTAMPFCSFAHFYRPPGRPLTARPRPALPVIYMYIIFTSNRFAFTRLCLFVMQSKQRLPYFCCNIVRFTPLMFRNALKNSSENANDSCCEFAPKIKAWLPTNRPTERPPARVPHAFALLAFCMHWRLQSSHK